MEVHHHAGKKQVEKLSDDPSLFKETADLINKAIAKAQYIKKLDKNQIVRATELKNQATELIGIIKEEYHLK